MKTTIPTFQLQQQASGKVRELYRNIRSQTGLSQQIIMDCPNQSQTKKDKQKLPRGKFPLPSNVVPNEQIPKDLLTDDSIDDQVLSRQLTQNSIPIQQAPQIPQVPAQVEQQVVQNQPVQQPPQPAIVPRKAGKNAPTAQFQCPECNVAPCSFPTIKGLYGHAYALSKDTNNPHHPEKIAERYRTAINNSNPKAICRGCGAPLSNKYNCETHERTNEYCRNRIAQLLLNAPPQPTLVSAPSANIQLPDYDIYTLSRFCSNTDKLALDKAYNQLSESFTCSKVETPAHINRFLLSFKMKVSTPKQHTVFLEDENIMLRKLRTAVSREFALQSIGKAYQRLEDHYDKVPRVYISEQEQREEFKRKHPDSKNLQFPPLPEGIAMQEQMDPITEDEIKSIILRIKKGKSSGDDGLTGSHLKYLVYQHEHFLKILEFFFNQLLSNPAHLQDCKQLFRFRAILLPKKSGGLRPVSCESMILAVFSSCLKTRLMQQVDIHEHQFCFKSGGITHALARVEQFKVQGKTLTLADCTNAYQAIDHNAIMHALQLQGVNSLFVEYYRAYLNTRSCKYADTLTTGVQAGNSVSSLAFSICLNYVITAMEAKGYQLTVFADDIQISHDPNVDKDVVLMELSELLQPLGLELALEKCSSTQNGGEITFLGQTFSQTSTSSLAERLTDKIDKCLKVLEASPITNHQKFLLLRSVVLPKVNYAPLVDFAPKTPLDSFDNQYGPIDQMVFKYASDLFAVKDLSETEQADFFTNSASKGGLEMVVPSLYYDFMQAQQKVLLRAEYLKTLQDHPGVPAIGYAINNFTYLTDNELFDLIKHRFQVTATYVLDVTFAVEANICNAFKGKILKYGGTYGDNRVIPLVLRYNGTVYEKSMNLLTKYLPEITDSFLSKHCCLAVARANEEAKLRYTSLITNALHDETIAIKHGQKRDRHATGRRAPRAPPGLEGVGARQEGKAQGNAGSGGLGTTADN
ncbi:Reverse_transcriptase (RNA-dependent DNA polymerase) [Hexamita inflata]|uniref:Reverse transcriptase (RNA-dependent DNA polymerase) n=1 Tax=Hexamita inflata TaxID=28002 RepID=A0AA86RPP7_9EUKA|nr:Reverse transcriptase (RNA-dependent DNA polymerase) [Hexamita inflata]